MSLSRTNSRARQSVFDSAPVDHSVTRCPPSLLDCVAALEGCCDAALDCEAITRDGTNGYSRMTKILSNDRVFILTSEGTVKRFKHELAESIDPTVNELIERAVAGLEVLRKRNTQLKARDEALKIVPARPTAGTTAQQRLEHGKLHALMKQKLKLEAELAALQAE
ncbi:hypothetical protein CYLTODRAFT_187231, partial [Cylindrobasidium torrendii FP15055 ss-10]